MLPRPLVVHMLSCLHVSRVLSIIIGGVREPSFGLVPSGVTGNSRTSRLLFRGGGGFTLRPRNLDDCWSVPLPISFQATCKSIDVVLIVPER